MARYNADLANNLGNLLSRVATVVAKKCGGIGPAPRADSPLAEVAARAPTPTRRRRGSAVQPSMALEATWRLIRETNAYLEANEPWKAEPGPASTPCSATPSRRCASSPCWPSPAVPAPAPRLWRRIGLAGEPADQRLPGAAAWGGYPGGLPVEKGDRRSSPGSTCAG